MDEFELPPPGDASHDLHHETQSQDKLDAGQNQRQLFVSDLDLVGSWVEANEAHGGCRHAHAEASHGGQQPLEGKLIKTGDLMEHENDAHSSHDLVSPGNAEDEAEEDEDEAVVRQAREEEEVELDLDVVVDDVVSELPVLVDQGEQT